MQSVEQRLAGMIMACVLLALTAGLYAVEETLPQGTSSAAHERMAYGYVFPAPVVVAEAPLSSDDEVQAVGQNVLKAVGGETDKRDVGTFGKDILHDVVKNEVESFLGNAQLISAVGAYAAGKMAAE